MVKELRHVDVSGNPELRRLAEEVALSGKPVVLADGGRDLATVSPAKRSSRAMIQKPSKADVKASREAAGSWVDVDVEDFMRYVYEGRQSSKPPVDL